MQELGSAEKVLAKRLEEVDRGCYVISLLIESSCTCSGCGVRRVTVHSRPSEMCRLLRKVTRPARAEKRQRRKRLSESRDCFATLAMQ